MTIAVATAVFSPKGWKVLPLQVPDLDVVIGLECTNFFHVVILRILRPPFLLALGETPNRMAKLVGLLTNAMVPCPLSPYVWWSYIIRTTLLASIPGSATVPRFEVNHFEQD